LCQNATSEYKTQWENSGKLIEIKSEHFYGILEGNATPKKGGENGKSGGKLGRPGTLSKISWHANAITD